MGDGSGAQSSRDGEQLAVSSNGERSNGRQSGEIGIDAARPQGAQARQRGLIVQLSRATIVDALDLFMRGRESPRLPNPTGPGRNPGRRYESYGGCCGERSAAHLGYRCAFPFTRRGVLHGSVTEAARIAVPNTKLLVETRCDLFHLA